jgi:hypothetical protein
MKDGQQVNDASASCRAVCNMYLMQICVPEVIDALREESGITNANKLMDRRSHRVKDLVDNVVRVSLTKERD